MVVITCRYGEKGNCYHIRTLYLYNEDLKKVPPEAGGFRPINIGVASSRMY